nr:MAG TPA: hypothetical protein [Caudoviricetes sp.]
MSAGRPGRGSRILKMRREKALQKNFYFFNYSAY